MRYLLVSHRNFFIKNERLSRCMRNEGNKIKRLRKKKTHYEYNGWVINIHFFMNPFIEFLSGRNVDSAIAVMSIKIRLWATLNNTKSIFHIYFYDP